MVGAQWRERQLTALRSSPWPPSAPRSPPRERAARADGGHGSPKLHLRQAGDLMRRIYTKSHFDTEAKRRRAEGGPELCFRTARSRDERSDPPRPPRL
ncbi:hypothetical protein EVAR_98626_1 [Eumeta japonica]|uniref:Uncharacterized protein n=1 Tax=Eumeta variegata TaxID=151549 RepID=A0A4C1XWX7_EUMVA|nr:hypothetical protein EVAR_98626_1 [Eumeta japonica]